MLADLQPVAAGRPLIFSAFSAEPKRPGYSAASVLSFSRQRVKCGKQTITLVVDKATLFVGVDP